MILFYYFILVILIIVEKNIMIFKQLETIMHCVRIITKIRSDGMYLPCIRIYNNKQNLLQECVYGFPLNRFTFVFQFASI
jgi:hypothetical protein